MDVGQGEHNEPQVARDVDNNDRHHATWRLVTGERDRQRQFDQDDECRDNKPCLAHAIQSVLMDSKCVEECVQKTERKDLVAEPCAPGTKRLEVPLSLAEQLINTPQRRVRFVAARVRAVRVAVFILLR